jgi:hypothetical protein
MYDKKGKYTGVIERIKGVVNAQLDPKLILENNLLDNKYSEYRDAINPDRK